MRWLDAKRNSTASDIQRGVHETTMHCIREDDASDLIIGRFCVTMACVMTTVTCAPVFFQVYSSQQ